MYLCRFFVYSSILVSALAFCFDVITVGRDRCRSYRFFMLLYVMDVVNSGLANRDIRAGCGILLNCAVCSSISFVNAVGDDRFIPHRLFFYHRL